MSSAQIAMVGLGVMGANLIRNIERNGFSCLVYNRTREVTDKFMDEFGSGSFEAAYSLSDLVEKLEKPRKIFLMIKAGPAVDAVLADLVPMLDKGDIVVDAGNSHFKDTVRRELSCAEESINFLGVGVSGGEEGALWGPSIMPGGPHEAWQELSPLFDKVAAEADGPCTTYIGPNGAGHFVKTVHNGIEYGDMQLIAEVYDFLRKVVQLEPARLAELFEVWNGGVLESYLIEITADVFRRLDGDSNQPLVDLILDKAGQKGTGRWTVEQALELGVAVPTLSAAVDARVLSSMKEVRVRASKHFDHSSNSLDSKDAELYELCHNALYCGKILCYAQGMDLLRKASNEYAWNLKLDEIASIWRGGCIIRARFLEQIKRAFSFQSDLENLLFDSQIAEDIKKTLPALRELCRLGIENAVPLPALNSSLAYFDSFCSEKLPQNLTQAQRDYFGAHTFERLDKSGTFHVDWTLGS